MLIFESLKSTHGQVPPINLWIYSKYSEPPSSSFVFPIII